MEFGEKLRGELDRQGVSVRGLAARLSPDNPEIERRSLQKYLAGMTPRRPRRDRITDALGLEPGSLDPEETL